MSDHYYGSRDELYGYEEAPFFQTPRSTFEDNNVDLADNSFLDDLYYEDPTSPRPQSKPKPLYIQAIPQELAYDPQNFERKVALAGRSNVTSASLHERSHQNLHSEEINPQSFIPKTKDPVLAGNYRQPEYRAINQGRQTTLVPHESMNTLTQSYNTNYRCLPSDDDSRQVYPKARNVHGIRLRPVSDLPDVYRSVFKFGVFNAVQSTCFEEVTLGDANLVISAPTGSGKTVLFELGIIRMLNKSKMTAKQAKCVYVAPTKALCSERFRDWVTKFEPIGLKCCELTGDTVVFGHNTWGDAKDASIIVTTCEKWDSLTRNWHEHENILSQIQLFLVDEVHVLNESRGSTLEVVTSRMKLRGSSIRFILVSATVPNIQDVANWIRIDLLRSEPAKVFEFGDEYRPCQLKRHVVGIPRRMGCNDFQFGKILDSKLFSVLQEFSAGKPILVFCSTRKGVFDTAEKLMKDFCDSEQNRQSLPWSHPTRVEHLFQDKRLNELAAVGVGVHHAGVSLEDRRATEQLYLKKVLRILVATSTLAVGVNLPAHMVVIKGVRIYQNSESKEYSDLDVMQMLGRAGRPQFDKDGIAVILCESELEKKYRALAQGKTVLESSLHLNLAEHLNSEIGLGTITDVESAKVWLRSTFLYQRMQIKPKYYAIEPTESEQLSEGIDDVIMQSVSHLKKSLLIEHIDHGSEVGKLNSTQFGEIMSKYYIRRATMDLILALPERASLKDILETICGADEFQDVKLRASEKKIFNALKNDVDIRFPVKKVENTRDKIFILVQSVLAGISLNNMEYKSADSQLHMDAFSVFKHVARISRAVLDVATVKRDGLTIKNSLELFRTLSGKAWEDRAIVFRQIEQVGEKSIKVLAEHGITSFQTLRAQNPLRLEALLNRRSPFGMDLLASVAELPQYGLRIDQKRAQSDGGKSPVAVDLTIHCELLEDKAKSSKSKKQRTRGVQMTAILTLTSDMDLIDLRRIPTKALKGGKSFEAKAELRNPSQSIVVIIASETIAGVAKQEAYKPDVPASEYPIMDTRPLSSVEMDLMGLEDDPDFWNMSLDGSDSPLSESQPKTLEGPCNLNLAVGEMDKRERPRARSDGRYECNHTCKNKTTCQHLCCNKGLSGPPQPSKRNMHDTQETVAKTASKGRKPHSGSGDPGAQKGKRVLEELDLIHERAQVSDGLRLTHGKRLKLESPRRTNRSRRPLIEHNVSFTDITDAESNAYIDVSGLFSDSDDLPEIILPNKLNSSGMMGRKERFEFTPTAGSLPQGSTSSHGRAQLAKPESPIKETKHKLPIARKDTLFLELSDGEASLDEVGGSDLNLFTKETTQDLDEPPEVEIKQNRIPSVFSVNREPDRVWEKPNERDKTGKLHTEDEDEFAELDAWLESGDVEIVS